MRGLLIAIVVLLACPVAAHADGRGVVTRNGRIGSLKIGKSTMADIKRFAGRPSKISNGVGEGGVRLTEVRYRCGSTCNTRFYLDANGASRTSSRGRSATGPRTA